MKSIIVFGCLLCLATVATTNAAKAAANQFPHHVGLSLNDGLAFTWCSGSLISNEWVLTAARCTADANTVKVTLGNTARMSPAKVYTVRYANIHTHPDFNQDTMANDIALLKIPAVQYTDAIQPIALPDRASSLDGEAVISSGWGYTTGPAPTSENLLFGNFNVISNSVCAKTHGNAKVSAEKLCASASDRAAACSGDFGGPLLLASSKVQVGISSFVASKGCEAGSPAAFTRVSSHLDWIKKTTGLNI